MTGSVLALVVIPIVAALGLAAWLAMVFYADANPLGRRPQDHAEPAGEKPESSPPEQKAA
jgi:hypothetical protein